MFKIIKLIPKCLYRLISKRYDCVYIVEPVDWSIRQDGLLIQKSMDRYGLTMELDTYSYCHRSKIIHFGSSNLLSKKSIYSIGRGVKVVATFFHGDYGIEKSMDERIDLFIELKNQIDLLILSNTTMVSRFIEWGFPKHKIQLIPIGIDLKLFNWDTITPPSVQHIKDGANSKNRTIIIGSFQKDGVGWDEGNEPKAIKGPDLLVESLKLLSKEYDIHVVLTGPARGYVKNKLSIYGIPYTHVYVEDYKNIVDYYSILDYYLITSREEGGPKAVLEALAMGVPLVTTKVGMAIDVIEHEQNGMLVNQNAEEIASAVSFLEHHKAIRRKIIDNGINKVKEYSFSKLSKKYASIYRGLIE